MLEASYSLLWGLCFDPALPSNVCYPRLWLVHFILTKIQVACIVHLWLPVLILVLQLSFRFLRGLTCHSKWVGTGSCLSLQWLNFTQASSQHVGQIVARGSYSAFFEIQAEQWARQSTLVNVQAILVGPLGFSSSSTHYLWRSLLSAAIIWVPLRPLSTHRL